MNIINIAGYEFGCNLHKGAVLAPNVISRIVRNHIEDMIADGCIKIQYDASYGPSFRTEIESFENAIFTYRGVIYTPSNYIVIYINDVNNDGCSVDVAIANKAKTPWCNRKVVTRDDYFMNTDVNFKISEIPDREPDYVSKTSKVWIFDDHIIRLSDYWSDTTSIGNCYWSLDSYSEGNCCGIAYFKDFKRASLEEASIYSSSWTKVSE